MVEHLFPSTAMIAQALPAEGGSMNWLYQFANNLSNLTTQNGGALTQVGMTELSFVSLTVLVSMVVNWNTSSMTLRLHHQPVRAGDLTNFIMRLIVCLLLENYWVNPFPGTTFGFNHLFSYFAQVMVQTLDQNSLTTLQALIADAGQHTSAPSLTAPIQILCYILVIILLGIASAILFLINVSGFILYGVAALFGPVFIPLYMTKTFRGKFLHFMDVLLSFAMIRAVASAFIFVWSGFMNGFIQQTFNNDYSMEKWIANLIPCVMVFLAFDINMLFVPSITQTIFGGGAGLAGRLEEAAVKLAAFI
jgi:type IV secretion system protein VirB6